MNVRNALACGLFLAYGNHKRLTCDCRKAWIPHGGQQNHAAVQTVTKRQRRSLVFTSTETLIVISNEVAISSRNGVAIDGDERIGSFSFRNLIRQPLL